MKQINESEIRSMDQRYRATLINSLAGVRPAVLVGTKSASGQTNLAVFNSLLHIGADPALWGLLIRPSSVRRDTLNNIMESGDYTINFISSGMHKAAHLTSAKFPENISEFESCGFREEYADDCSAPFVGEAIVKVALKKFSTQEISINGTTLVIGSIQKIITSDDLIGADGFFNPEQADVLTCAGLDAYTRVVMSGRWSYARPDQPLHPIDH